MELIHSIQREILWAMSLVFKFCLSAPFFHFFFFQAEDGIRYRDVTGVQTCAFRSSSPGCQPTGWRTFRERAPNRLRRKGSGSAKSVAGHEPSGVHTAPLAAEDTSRAYLASAPVVYRGAGAFHPSRRLPSSASSTSRSRRRVSTSSTIVSPSSTSAMGPPTVASGATWPTANPCEAPENRPSVTSATSRPSPAPTMAPVTASI